jgi:hypothetical protein
MRSQITKEDIDEMAASREFDSLALYITDETLTADVREHLAHTIRGLLTGKPRRGRPPQPRGATWWRRNAIGERVWRTQRRHGWPKVESAVEHVAKELGISPRQVWKCWRAFDPVRAEAALRRALQIIP